MARTITAWDREWFKRCRRAWDFGSRARQNYEPADAPAELDVERALRDALAVWYFPGMWEWNRDIVRPLTFQAYDRSIDKQHGDPASEAAGTGRQLLEAYLEWAPTVDRFWPVRVESDYDIQIPDPANPGSDLVVPEGPPIRLTGRLDLLVVDEHDAYWVVRHRLVTDNFTPTELLFFDDETVTACWAWEIYYLGMRLAGTIHNELRPHATTPDQQAPAIRRPRPQKAWAQARAGHRRMYAQATAELTDIVVDEGGDSFRRTRLPRPPHELENVGRRLAAEARDMTDPDLVIYPTPDPDHCGRCDYRSPCIALNEGIAAEAALASGYRQRPEDLPEEGRLGGGTWSMSRGAAPPPNWRSKSR